jgi:hypothetical protein
MNNTTILIILLLFVSLYLFIKKEGFDIKNNLVVDMDEKINKMNNDYKVFNDETEILANYQFNTFIVLSSVTLFVIILTIVYVRV